MPRRYGRRGLDKDGTTMVILSNHIPILTEMEAIRVPVTVLVFLRHNKLKGMIKQNKNIPQNKGANLPKTLDCQTEISRGSCPYQVVKYSPKVKQNNNRAIT